MSTADHDESGEARRQRFSDDVHARTGVDDAMIARLVHAFYGKVRADSKLGPVFAARISDWGPHLERMCAFWSSVTLRTGRYHGRPMPAHAPLPIDGSFFDRWLAIFEETAREECPPEAADLFIEKARLIAESLELGIATFRGVVLAKGERLTGTP